MKNISQLTHDIDSMNKRYIRRVDDLFKEYTTSLLYNERYIPGENQWSQEEALPPGEQAFKAKILYDSLSLLEKRTVMSKAIGDIKSASNFLSAQNEILHNDVKFIKRFEVNWNKKFTLAIACLVFFFIGAPLGAIIRKGGLGTPAVISILFFVIWYVISLSGEKLVEENLVSTTAGMWASTYILLPIGLFLTYKASTDSVIMNIDTYLAFFKRIKDYLYRRIIMGTRRNPSYEEQ